MNSYTWRMRLSIFLAVAVVASLLAGVFWGCWQLSAKGVPQVSKIRMWWGVYLSLGWTLSRWWDVLCFGLWAGLMSQVVCADDTRQLFHEEFSDDLAPVIVIPGAVSLVLSVLYWIIGPLIPLGLGLVAAVIVGLAIADSTAVENRECLPDALRHGWKQGMLCALFFSGWFALFYSFSNGMVFGLLMNLFAGLVWAVGVGCGLTVGLIPKAAAAPEPDPPDPARQDDLCPGGQRPGWMLDK